MTQGLDSVDFAGKHAFVRVDFNAPLADGVISDETFATAQAALSDKALVELTSIVGHYVHVSMTLNAFQVPLPADIAPTLPDAPVF